MIGKSQGYSISEIRDQAEQNAKTIKAQEADRIRYRLILEHAYKTMCQGQEDLKAKERDRAREQFKNLDETLELLGLERTDAIEERAKRDYMSAMERFAPTPCVELPDPR